MRSTKDKHQRSTAGFTAVPNEVLFNRNLTATEFRVYAALLSYAWGRKTTAKASQKEIHERTGIHRETVGDTFERLIALGIIKPLTKLGKGRKATYQVRDLLPQRDGSSGTFCGDEGSIEDPSLSKGDGSSGISDDGSSGISGAKGDGSSGIKQTKQSEHKHNNTLAPDATSAPDVTSSRGFNGGGLSAADAKPDVTFGVPANRQAEEGTGNREAQPTVPASVGRNALQSQRPLTMAEINAALVRPDGFRASDDYEDLSNDLEGMILPMVIGEPFKQGVLNKLVADHGVRLCHFWAHWLSRKIADEYDRKQQPVRNPTGLYIKVVREGGEANPEWPQFDERRHTVKAREEFEKRKTARDADDISRGIIPRTDYTEDDVTRFAEEVRRGEREVRHLLPQMRRPVQRRLDELCELDEPPVDEFEECFGWSATKLGNVDVDLPGGASDSANSEEASFAL